MEFDIEQTISPCPFCGTEGKKDKKSTANVFIFNHKPDCFLFIYKRIQDFQFDKWNKRTSTGASGL